MRLGTFSNNGLGFGLAFTLVDDFTMNSRRIERQMASLTGASTAMAASVEASMARAKLGATGLLISLVGLAGWGAAAKVDATFQKYALSIEGFVGSAERAKKVFSDIQNAALVNPNIGIETRLKASSLLLAQGLDPDRVKSLTGNLADMLTALGRGTPEFTRISLDLEKIAAQGRVTGIDIRQMGRAGIPVLEILTDYFGKKMPKNLKNVDISVQDLQGAFEKAMESGGKWKNALDTVLGGSVFIKGMQAAQGFRNSLASIGKAIEPFTNFILDVVNTLLRKLQEFAATDIGKWTFRFLLALNLLLFGLSALIAVTALSRVLLFRLAGAFGATTKATVMTAFATNGATAAWGVMGQQMLVAARAMLPMLARLAGIYLAYKLINSTDNSGIYALGTAVLFVLGPIGKIIAVYALVSRSFREFRDVMNGLKQPAQGLVGWFQRLGGALTFIGAAFKGYNAQTKEIEIPKKLLMALDKMGMGDWARKTATWIGRIMEAWEGFKVEIGKVWDTITGFILDIANLFRPASDQLRSWDDFLNKNSTSLDVWRNRGKLFADILLVIAGAWAVMGIASLLNSAKVLLGLFAISWELILISAAIMGLISLFTDFGTSGDKAATSVTDSLSSIDGMGIGKNIGEGLVDGILASIGLGGNSINKKLTDSVFGINRKSGWTPYLQGYDTKLTGDDAVNPHIAKDWRYEGPDNTIKLNPKFNLASAMATMPLNTGLSSGMVGMLQIQEALRNISVTKGQDKKGDTITVNLNIDGKKFTQVVLDTANYNKATSYGTTVDNQLSDSTYGNQSYLNALPDAP